MKRALTLIAILLTLCVGAFAQEAAVRVSLHDPELRVELGTTVLKEPTAFGLPFRAWAGVGSTVEQGKLVGSFAGLFEIKRTQQLSIELGGGYLAKNEDGTIRGRWDLLAQVSLSLGQGSAFHFAPSPRGGFGLGYSRRY